MEMTAKCVLLTTIKKVSKKEKEYLMVTALDNTTGETFNTYSDDFELLKLDKLKEYTFNFSYNDRYKSIKIIGVVK